MQAPARVYPPREQVLYPNPPMADAVVPHLRRRGPRRSGKSHVAGLVPAMLGDGASVHVRMQSALSEDAAREAGFLTVDRSGSDLDWRVASAAQSIKLKASTK